MVLNQKGQGSGVFQLLISAVVALAILGVLLGIIGGLPSIGSQDPETAARTTLKDAYTALGSVRFSSKVTLTKDRVLTRSGVTPKEIGLDREKVCITWKDNYSGIFAEGSSPDGSKATYTGVGSRDVKIAALCDEGSALGGSSGSATTAFGADLVPPDCTRTPQDPDAQETFCVIVILPP